MTCPPAMAARRGDAKADGGCSFCPSREQITVARSDHNGLVVRFCSSCFRALYSGFAFELPTGAKGRAAVPVPAPCFAQLRDHLDGYLAQYGSSYCADDAKDRKQLATLVANALVKTPEGRQLFFDALQERLLRSYAMEDREETQEYVHRTYHENQVIEDERARSRKTKKAVR